MKPKIIAVTFLSMVVFTVGCKPAAENSVAENRNATAAQLDKVNNETREAAQEMKDYAYTQRTEFVETMKSQLAALTKEMDELSARIEKASEAEKAEAKPKLQALREQGAKLTEKLEEARNATESSWNDVQAAFKKGYSELKDGFQQARQWTSEKIAP